MRLAVPISAAADDSAVLRRLPGVGTWGGDESNLRGHDWDEVLGCGLELADSIYSLFVLALFGALVGLGAAILLGFPRWVGVTAGALLMPLSMVILSRAVAGEDHRNRC